MTIMFMSRRCAFVFLSAVLNTSLLFLASCKRLQQTEQTDVSSASASGLYDVVLAQCFAPQGNGGNWAATLSWVSEEINIRVTEARLLVQQGKRVGIHLGCMLGGSSGSVTTSVMSALLSNRNIMGSKGPQDILTPDETALVASAVRYIAFSVDLNLTELVRFFGQAFWTQGSTFVTQKALQPLVENLFGTHPPHWWKNSTVDPSMILVDFSTSIHLASTLTPELVRVPISTVLSGQSLSAYQSRGVNLVHELPSFASFDAMVKSPANEFDALSRGLEAQAAAIGKQSDEFISKQFSPGAYRLRHGVELGPNGKNSDYKLRQTLEKPLALGFCTISMAALVRNKEELQTTPHYVNLSPVVFCRKETIEKILSSPLYQKHVKSGHEYASRFVLAVVPTVRGAIVPSIREPNLMAPLRSALGSQELEVSEFYHPGWDKEKNGRPTFSLMNADKVNLGKGDFVPFAGIGGGFPDQRISAWMIGYFLDANVTSSLSAKARDVRVTMSLFGRDRNQKGIAFHKNAVQNVFSKSPEEGLKNLKDWVGFINGYCDTMASHLQAALKAKIETVFLDWDVTRLPAAQQPGGASRLIVVKSANATRLQVGQGLSSLGFVFDPLIKSQRDELENAAGQCRE